MSAISYPMKYVDFCDILGFNDAVIRDFEATKIVYKAFRNNLKLFLLDSMDVSVSIYSGSILVISDELPPVFATVQALHWAAMIHKLIIKGGIAYGKHWHEFDGNSMYVVSDALVKAVAIEKTTKVPAIAISNDIRLGLDMWIPQLYDVLNAPLFFYDGLVIVNPFNYLWFASSKIIASHLLDAHPSHKEEYQWFLSLFYAVDKSVLLIPESIINKMLKYKILTKI